MSPIQQVVHDEWCAVLGVDRVGPDDDFFEAGGDSIAAVALVTRIRDRAGIEFPLSALFLEGTFGAVVGACAAAEAPSP